jgi:1-acyl-sn-glycerol-3-phosphate acyltransferase
MRFFDFILLKRNDWAHDKRAIEENLDRVNPSEPLWLVVFPEGTVVSRGTRKRSTTFAQKAGLVSHRWTCVIFTIFVMKKTLPSSNMIFFSYLLGRPQARSTAKN